MKEMSYFFMHKNIKKVQFKPEREHIKISQKYIQENRNEAPCEFDSDKYGCLSLVMKGTD